jgi:Uma2 family endonuclease
MASLPDTLLTEEQYLALERTAETKSEFHDGRMFAMAGGSPNHSLLANNIGAILRGQVPTGCRTFNSDLRVKVAPTGLYTYPDCTVICGDLQFAGDQRDVVLNPLLIVEVLSPSTEGYDRGKKFESYRTIESLKEYLLIHQDRRHVEHYSKRDDGSWLLREYSGTEPTLAIPRLNTHILLADLYSSALDLD